MMWSPVKLVSNLLTQLASGNQKCRQLLYNVNTIQCSKY